MDYEINAVIVDEQVMLTQPPRLLAAGILDAMAKYIEIATLHPQVLDENTTIASIVHFTWPSIHMIF